MTTKATIGLAVAVCASFSSGPALAREPQPIAIERWVTTADNLDEASRLGLDGTVFVELTVSATGTVTGCRIVQSSGHSMLDEHTCQLMSSRARFEPATDDNGRAVAGTFSHSVGWQVITNATWAANGMVRAETIIDPARGPGPRCAAEIMGEMSDYMKQMACFVLLNQRGNILEALTPKREAPFKAVFVLAVYPQPPGAAPQATISEKGQRVSYSRATVLVNPQGRRSDCRMAETDGPSAMIFPICGPTPQFSYVPGKQAAADNVATELRQEVAYYVDGS